MTQIAKISSTCKDDVNMANKSRRLTASAQQVLQGYTWRVQGSNGLNASQFSNIWGRTLSFQRNVGVSWVFGLRHGVAMHPRGRHLRESMTLLSSWESHTTAREQQPPPQSQHDNRQARSHKVSKDFGVETAIQNWKGIQQDQTTRQLCKCKGGERICSCRRGFQHDRTIRRLEGNGSKLVSFARGRSEELYSIYEVKQLHMRQLVESPQGTEPFGVA